jgi:hypothetical protein
MEVTMIAALRMMLVVCPGLPIKARSVHGQFAAAVSRIPPGLQINGKAMTAG